MSPLRVIGDQVSKQHFGKQSLIGYSSNVGGRFIGTSINISNLIILGKIISVKRTAVVA